MLAQITSCNAIQGKNDLLLQIELESGERKDKFNYCFPP